VDGNTWVVLEEVDVEVDVELVEVIVEVVEVVEVVEGTIIDVELDVEVEG
jgi:hypothetical protein